MSLARDITTVGGGTLASRLLAYVRDAAIAALLGTGPLSEAFFVVLQVVNFFRRLLAEGALNSAFVPIWLKLNAGEDGAAVANRFTTRTLATVGCVTGVIALLTVVLAHVVIAVVAPGFDGRRHELAAFLLVIVSPYVVLTGLVAVISAALNAEHRVIAVAVSTAMFNLVLVGLLIFVMLHHVELFYVSILLAVGVVAAGALQLAIIGAAWIASSRRFLRTRGRPRAEPFFARAWPGLIAAGAPQLKLIGITALVSSSPAAVSWLYYANRLYELPLGVASIAIATVIVPRIAASVHAADPGGYTQAQSRACEIALGLALPAAMGFALLAPQIASGLFEHGEFGAADTDEVATALLAICSGLPGHVLEKLFGAVSFAHEDTKTPMLAALGGLTTAVVVGIILFELFGFIGAAAAIAISAWVGAGLIGIAIYRRGWLKLDALALQRLPRIVASTVLMGAAVTLGLVGISWLFPAFAATAVGRLVALFVLVVIGMIAYGAAIDRLGVAKINELIAAVRQEG